MLRVSARTARLFSVILTILPFSGTLQRDVDCGRVNGFRTVAVESGWVPRATLEAAQPDALFEDLTDLPAVLLAFGLD